MSKQTTLIKAAGLDLAIIGVAEGIGIEPCVAYSFEKSVLLLMQQGMTEEEAIEHIDVNLIGAYVGGNTPIVIHELETYEA